VGKVSRVALLRRRAMRRGLFGGSKGWTYLWVVLFAARMLRKLTTGKEEILLTETIEPGQTFVISGGRRGE